MKNFILPFFLSFCFFFTINAQQQFDPEEYILFRNSTTGLEASQLAEMYSMPSDYYYKGYENGPSLDEVSYLDSVIIKLDLTKDEIALLRENHFFVSERLNYYHFGIACHEVYNRDLPVFISTDLVLHALHISYDKILKTLEREVMSANLEAFLESLYEGWPALEKKYGGNTGLADALRDADTYVTIAYSLIKNNLFKGHYESPDKLRKIWDAIFAEQITEMPLFTFDTRNRKLDFSQFRPRGHYAYTEQDGWMGYKSLEPYFRAMMWLGRIDFLLSPPPSNPWEPDWTNEEIVRMNLGAFMVHELYTQSAMRSLMEENNTIINYLVGVSDNLTPEQYQSVLEGGGVSSAGQLLAEETFGLYYNALQENPAFGQKILSNFFFMDPYSEAPGTLPISYKLSGQRFIIDSYVFSNVVFDRIVYQGKKMMRMMPDPLDILFVLGNNDALPLLEEQVEKYKYASQLANLRYLADSKDDAFWSESLYNVWLNAVRALNPKDNTQYTPFFMKTAAWHQEKMNTQLSSWAQLRHDNLLYAKQSYTGGTGCSFPFSYVEPYPEFYATIAQFARDAGSFFRNLPSSGWNMQAVIDYFPGLAEVMENLETLSRKELAGEAFSDKEHAWLQSMMFVQGGSGVPPYSGWITDLFFDEWDVTEIDYIVADVHTQPTDESGHVVGKVLHAGTGKINLGVFIAENPCSKGQLMAFTGPVMSFYQHITDDFYRMTDQEWAKLVRDSRTPQRPGWTNIYLAGQKGEVREKGAELPSVIFTGTPVVPDRPNHFILNVYPNPFTDKIILEIMPGRQAEAVINVYNSTGILVKKVPQLPLLNGMNSLELRLDELPRGIYLGNVTIPGSGRQVFKVMKR